MFKKLLILSCSLITASAFGLELPEESIQKIDAHIEKLQELRRTAIEAGDKQKANDIAWCIEEFGNRAFGQKTLGGVAIANGAAWELGDDRLGGGLTSRWQLWDTDAISAVSLKPWVRAAKTIKIRAPKETYLVKIQDITTILDIKDYLQEDQGMLVQQQSINPVMPIWWTLGYLERKAAALHNDTMIKFAMNMYNTDVFELHLQIKTQEQN
ncbi:MAG: hypothetical protein K2X90_00265 [Candidatus Babeliaceae bacterium]|nr:hypothetical protein [Candidatus Babeliaceae bacterium]